MDRGSFAINLNLQDLERAASKRYKSFAVRYKLKRVPKEVVECNAFLREEDVRRLPHRYIDFIKSSDWHAQPSNR